MIYIRNLFVVPTFFLLAVAAPMQAAKVTVLRSATAVISYEQRSSDGCTVLQGEIGVIDANGGDNPAGVYVTAIRQNLCDPNNHGSGFAGFAAPTNLHGFGVYGVISANVRGPIVVNNYSGSGEPPLTFELDLTCRGTGKITTDRQMLNEGNAITLIVNALRAATTSGKITINGAPATITSTSLSSQTRTTFTR